MYIWLDGPRNVEVWEGPGQFLHPIPDCAGRYAGHRPLGFELPLPVGDRGPGQWRRRLGSNTFTGHVLHLSQSHAALLWDTSSYRLKGAAGDWLIVYNVWWDSQRGPVRMGFPHLLKHFIVLFKRQRYLIFSFCEIVECSFIPVRFWKEGNNPGRCYWSFKYKHIELINYQPVFLFTSFPWWREKNGFSYYCYYFWVLILSCCFSYPHIEGSALCKKRVLMHFGQFLMLTLLCLHVLLTCMPLFMTQGLRIVCMLVMAQIWL